MSHCNYCGNASRFALQTIVACDENDVDETFEGFFCQTCGEYGGQAHLKTLKRPADWFFKVKRKPRPKPKLVIVRENEK